MKTRIMDKLKDTTDRKNKKKKMNYDDASKQESDGEEYYLGKDRHDERKRKAYV